MCDARSNAAATSSPPTKGRSPCITALTPDDIASARVESTRWKLLASARREGDHVVASVQPEPIPLHHPLASVSGPTNAITYSTDLLGDVTLVGPGAGRLATGFA